MHRSPPSVTSFAMRAVGVLALVLGACTTSGLGELSSDGSNSSRKENVPPELMICIDMKTGDDSAGSDHMRTYSRSKSSRNGLEHWRSLDHEPLSSDQESQVGWIHFHLPPVVSSHKLLSLLGNSARYGHGVAFVCYGLMLTIILLG